MLGSFAMPVSEGPFGPAAEAFNPSKWDAETEYLSDGGQHEASPANIDAGSFLRQYWAPMLIVAAALWLLEKRRIKIGGAIKGSASA